MAIKVFLADDHAVVRDGLKALLESQGDITVVGDAADGRDAVRQIRLLKPGVVVMDISMPSLNGIDATRQILEIDKSIRVVILSMHATAEHVYRAFDAGAQGYVLKESAGKEVIDAIHSVHNNRRYLSDKITNIMIDDYVQKGRETHRKSPLERLSGREREVLQLVVEGKSSSEIADIVHLSPKTVETYRSRIMQKLEINDIPSLVKFSIEHGITTSS